MSLSSLFAALLASAALATALPAAASGKFSAISLNGGTALPQAAGGDLIVDFTNIPSSGEFGDPSNTVLTYYAAPGALIDQIDWNFTVTAYSPSWLADMTLAIFNSAGEGVYFTPSDEWSSGTVGDIGSASLVDYDISFNLLADGKLQLRFFETYVDNPDGPDGIWNSGVLTFHGITSAVPEPSHWALMALGLVAVGARLRRRRD